MRKITLNRTIPTDSGASFTAAHLGALRELGAYELSVPILEQPIEGKVFLKAVLGMTGMEASVNRLPPGGATPFHHRHRAHEELYFFIAGRGQMHVDDRVFDVREGTAVRVATRGARSLRASKDEELHYLCIQAREGSMPDQEAADDGWPVERCFRRSGTDPLRRSKTDPPGR